MFLRLPDALRPTGSRIGFEFEGRALDGLEGETVAAALLANGVAAFGRRPETDVPRGPYCLMGVCQECLVVIDGRSSQQACRVRLQPGMRIESQIGRRDPAA